MKLNRSLFVNAQIFVHWQIGTRVSTFTNASAWIKEQNKNRLAISFFQQAQLYIPNRVHLLSGRLIYLDCDCCNNLQIKFLYTIDRYRLSKIFCNF
jgi:hypothetical protein